MCILYNYLKKIKNLTPPQHSKNKKLMVVWKSVGKEKMGVLGHEGAWVRFPPPGDRRTSVLGFVLIFSYDF
jgi:hypothetical protein